MDFSEWYLMVLNFAYQTLIVLGTLSILVLIHEFGHFIAARYFGVKVFEFSFGMGRLLYSKQMGDTDYQIRLIPMGGYVKLAGEDSIYDIDYIPEKDEFYGISPIKRLGVVFAGPFMNLMLAFITFWMVIFFMGENLTKPVVGYLEKDSLAYVAGIRSGDIITSIDGEEIESFEQVSEAVFKNKNEKLFIEVVRNGKSHDFETIPALKLRKDIFGDVKEYGDLGLNFFIKSYVGEVMEGSPAEKLGLKKKDLIVKIDGKKIFFWDELLMKVQSCPEKKISMEWKRGDELFKGEIIPEQIEAYDENGMDKILVGRIGISVFPDEEMTFHKDVTLFYSFYDAAKKLTLNTYLTYKVLKKLLLGQISKDNLMGPVRLAGMVSDFAKNGFFPWLLFLGFISHQLAIINFLPFPALDGGHAVFFILEFFTGKRLNLKIQDMINRVGFSLLIALFIFVVVNDITNLIGK